MLDRIQILLAPPVCQDDEDRTRVAALLHVMLISWFVMGLVFVPIGALAEGSQLGVVIALGTVSALAPAMLVMLRRSISSGITDGLQWFLPYGWPSVMAALEVLAGGLFLGLACLCLAPVFRTGGLEHAMFWTLLATGVLCLMAALGQVINSSALQSAGLLAWRPGLTIILTLMAIWFRGGTTSGVP